MLLVFTSGKFVFRCDFTEKEIAKSAGCRWNPDARHWWTDRAEVARKLEKYADISAREQLEKAAGRIKESKMADADIEIPKPEGLEYLGYQKAGIAFALRCFGFDFSKTLKYIKGVGKEENNANRNLYPQARTQKENDGMFSNGKDSASKGNCTEETKEECRKRRMENEGFFGDKNKNAGTKNEEETSCGDSEIAKNSRRELQRREWAGRNRDNKKMGEGFDSNGIYSRISDSDTWAQDSTSIGANKLQSGFCEFGGKSCYRIGRAESQGNEKENFRQEENGNINVIGMENSQNPSQVKGGLKPFRSCGVLIADEMG
jgi:hypothetical protein